MRGIMKVFFVSLIISLVISGLATALASGIIKSRFGARDIDIDVLKIDSKPTIIYDKNGDTLARFKKERKDVTKFEEIPKEVIDGIISTEDRDFYEHPGINIKTIARAAVINARHGEFNQGGSTITQQLVKVMYLTPDKKLDRKIQEAVDSTLLESKLSKNEILTHYLNHIFYGHNAYGIKGAIHTFFGETLEEFNEGDRIERIAKGALMAGLPNLPTDFSPYGNPEGALERRNIVITNMYTEKKITKDEYNQAIKMPLLVLEQPKLELEDEKIDYPEFVHYVLAEASIKLGFDEGDVTQVTEDGIRQAMHSGTKIYTSFDKDVYNILRKHISRDELFPANASDGTKVQASMSIVDPKTGEIYAFTGGRETPNFLEYNRAFQQKRQPGSTFKPLIAYGPALESGKFQPYSMLAADRGHTFPGGYVVKDHGSASQRTMATSIQYSYNVPAVWTLEQVGVKYAREYAEKLGIKLTDQDNNLAIALGGVSEGVSPLQMSSAYQAFANGGKMSHAHAIKKIISSDGEPIYTAPKPEQIIKKENADKMRFMLRDVVTSGTGTGAAAEGHMVAGKTGTTEMPGTNGGNKDIWFVGFTKDYVGSVWMGFDQSDSSHFLWDASGRAATMFGAVINDLVKIKPDLLSAYRSPEDMTPEVEDAKLSSDLVSDGDAHQINLSWTSKSGMRYKLYKNGVELTETSGSSYTDSDVYAGNTYTYKVVGFDRETNYKTMETNAVSIYIQEPEPEPEPEPEVEEDPTPIPPATTEPVTPPGGDKKPGGSSSNGSSKPNDSQSNNGSSSTETPPTGGGGGNADSTTGTPPPSDNGDKSPDKKPESDGTTAKKSEKDGQ